MTNVANTEENVTPVVEEAVKPAKKRTPRVKNRPDAEILELAINKLTEKEKDRVITLLKEERELIKVKAEHLQANCKTAFEQARQLEENYNNMEAYYRNKLKFINSQTASFTEVINATVKGGIN